MKYYVADRNNGRISDFFDSYDEAEMECEAARAEGVELELNADSPLSLEAIVRKAEDFIFIVGVED